MGLVSEIQKILNKGIENERKLANEKFDKEKEKVNSLKTVPSMIKVLLNVYGNSYVQGVKMKEIFKDYLKADFFKKAEKGEDGYEAWVGTNYLIYKRNSLYVKFPKYKSNVIMIGLENALIEPKKPNSKIDKYILNFIEDWVAYEKEKSKESYKKVLESYSIVAPNSNPSILDLFKKKSKKYAEIKEYVETKKQELEFYIEKIKIWEDAVKKYELEKEKICSDIDEIHKDLIEFQVEGWKFKYEKLDNLLAEPDKNPEKKYFKLPNSI